MPTNCKLYVNKLILRSSRPSKSLYALAIKAITFFHTKCFIKTEFTRVHSQLSSSRTIYYSNSEAANGSISKAKYDGSGRDLLVSGVGRVAGIMVDYHSKLCPLAWVLCLASPHKPSTFLSIQLNYRTYPRKRPGARIVKFDPW